MNPNFNLIKTFNNTPAPILFIDFDGTISKCDVIDRILEEFADARWLEIEAKWVAGEIGSRECLRKQFALISATPGELNEFLDTLELDEGFLSLLNACRKTEMGVHIISDGFDYYIRRLLERNLPQTHLKPLNIWANGLIPHGKNSWRTKFPYFRRVCKDGCATCKPRVMREQNEAAALSLFVGDGLSDRFAAGCADIVFAKHKLSEYCLKNAIPHTTYSSLKQVAESINEASELDNERQWQRAA